MTGLKEERRFDGQSLNEYGLLGGLLVLAVIPALLLLGGNVTGLFKGLLAKPAQAPAIAATQVNPSGLPAGQSINTQSPAGNIQTLTTDNGTTVKLYTQAELNKSVMTSGANGTTTLLAGQIEIIAKQLLDAGEIDAKQYQGIIDLANQGHKIAGIEKLLEDAAALYESDPKAFDSLKIQYEGESYTPLQLGKMLGYEDIYSMQWLSGQNESETLYVMYENLKSSGALEDPVVQSNVEGLVNRINAIADGVQTFMYQTDNSTAPVLTEKIQDALATVPDPPASETTHQTSGEICTVGNGQDSGTNCQG